MTHLRVADVLKAIPFAPPPPHPRDIEEQEERAEQHRRWVARKRLATRPLDAREEAISLVASSALNGLRACLSTPRASFTNPEKRLNLCAPFLGELPTCPTCAVLWDVACELTVTR